MGSAARLSAPDYVVFSLTLLLSASVGIFHAWRGSAAKKKASKSSKDGEAHETDDFLMGGRKLPVLPVALSLMTTFVSGFSLLGVPAEVYQRGMLMWVYQMMGAPALLICAYLFLPIFYDVRPISIYEYFELRFKSLVIRRLAATLFLLNTLFYMGVVMYAPSIALSGVTGVPTYPFIISVGAVCTFYTTLGGLKSVVWTDTLQSGFMYAGVLTLIIKGTIDSGGPTRVWEIASQSERFRPFENWSMQPNQYFTMWIALFGGLSFWMSLYGLNQMSVQRYCSLRSLRQARIVIGITAPAYIVLLSVCCLIGLVMTAFFWSCDPLVNKEIATKDQLVILFVTKTLGNLQGLPGLFLACLFSGTLSTISSCINSMAAVTWEDFLKTAPYFRTLNDQQASRVNRALVLTYGVCAVGLAFAAGPMGGIIQAAISMMGSLAGPLVGMFFLGVLMPRANKYGALLSCLISMSVCIWITMGSIIHKPYAGYKLPYNNTACLNTTIATNQSTEDPFGNREVFILYRISSYLFSFIGIALVAILGPIISLLVGREFTEQNMTDTIQYTIFRKPKKVSELDEDEKTTFSDESVKKEAINMSSL